ncbi:substrate-binding domain-containing protein [Rubellicoccus peritrichatus]|uniref:Substrate-binding domain-containing protein n=1 Tax=Rubellicoccus peritrichatus TaxID=3080537 RepID=A0AAQ3L8S1_9BACT|nr:substrate-binding domain-containing protein [Puniceicoccus sp. CR14]WOO40931.1 substrate-binding domain-containing protein [Puniceicoccus sp. CR14]
MMGFEVAQPGQSIFNQTLLEYSRNHSPWEMIASTVVSVDILHALEDVGCDGAIIRITSPEIRAAAQRASFPVVNNSSWLENPGVPSVLRDDRVMGNMAVEHLLELGFKHFIIIDTEYGWLIKERIAGFIETLRQHQVTWEIYHMPSLNLPEDEFSKMVRWMKERPLPSGLLLSDSSQARTVYNVLEEADLSIPLDVAPISVIQEPTAYSQVSPSLSYVDPDEESCCYAVAELLDRLMRGERVEPLIRRIPAIGVVEKDSTNIELIEDRTVARAIDFIRKHAHEPINAAIIAEAISIAPATLARHFRDCFSMGPYAYLCQVRVDRAAELLRAEPDMSLSRVAKICGFTDRNRFNKVFQRIKKQSPASWREGDD